MTIVMIAVLNVKTECKSLNIKVLSHNFML